MDSFRSCSTLDTNIQQASFTRYCTPWTRIEPGEGRCCRKTKGNMAMTTRFFRRKEIMLNGKRHPKLNHTQEKTTRSLFLDLGTSGRD